MEDIEAVTIKRARRIEVYFLVWLSIDIVCAFIVASHAQSLVSIAAWLSMFHVFEICQTAINIAIFDKLRISGRPHFMASLARTLILSAANFVQICICFATFYAAHPNAFEDPLTSWSDAFYFSAATQLTVGYGDILPLGSFRLVAASQAFIGFFFALAVLGRFISFLPATPSVIGDDDHA
jgi:hypothetical protein